MIITQPPNNYAMVRNRYEESHETRSSNPGLDKQLDAIQLSRIKLTPEKAEIEIARLVKNLTGRSRKTELLLARHKAPASFPDGRKYGFPEEFHLRRLSRVFTRKVNDVDQGERLKVPAVYFALGMRRSRDDPQLGRINRYWHMEFNKDWYYAQADVSAWIGGKLYRPESHPPVMWLAVSQAEVVRMFSEGEPVYRELVELAETTQDRKLAGHYRRLLRGADTILQARKEEVKKRDQGQDYDSGVVRYGARLPAFLHPHRSLLLALNLLKITEKLGIKTLSIQDKPESSIYRTSYDFLRQCETDVKIVLVDEMSTDALSRVVSG